MKVTGSITVEVLPTTGNLWHRLTTPKQFRLHDPIKFEVAGAVFTIPAGWSFDFASVPRCAKWLFPDDAIDSFGACLHDYLYKSGAVSKWLADALFYSALREVDKIPVCYALLMWFGVAVGGWFAWWNHRKKDNFKQSEAHK